jgi:hypothetical protein
MKSSAISLCIIISSSKAFDISEQPNNLHLDAVFGQNSLETEINQNKGGFSMNLEKIKVPSNLTSSLFENEVNFA